MDDGWFIAIAGVFFLLVIGSVIYWGLPGAREYERQQTELYTMCVTQSMEILTLEESIRYCDDLSGR